MEMIDKDRLFGLFGGDENVAKEILDRPDTFLDTATAKLGMFTKLIYNHEVFHNKLKKFMEQVKEDYDVEVTKNASSFTVYNRAWFYIKDINLKDRSHFDAVVGYKYKPLYDSLIKAISYFEKEEEYEKCAKLLKIQELKRKVKNN
tara:strand:- start:387 stop:824 length:438 start_codon:yes stop_codon:yes gene_type:complete